MSDISALKADIESAVKDVPYTFGVAIKYLESGAQLALNADRTYQLASVFKVPILVTAMQQVDAGKLSLDTRVVLRDSMKTSPSGIICYLREGLQPTIEDLLMLMIIISDNTATDMVLDLLGGPLVVNGVLRRLGFGPSEINIIMSVHKLFEDIFGSSAPVLLPSQMFERAKQLGVNFDGEVYRQGSTVNVCTPVAMNRLHEMIFRGQAASRAACDKALEIMLHQTLNLRLPSQLPPGTDVAHKTGTIFGTRNDSGIIYVAPDKHVAVTVFSSRNAKPSIEDYADPSHAEEEALVDKTIGRIGRLAYDYAAKLG